MSLMSMLKAFYKAFISPNKAKVSHSQFAEDLLINLSLLGLNNANRFYVDVGCHSPKRGSNTYNFYKKGWKGILIDLEDEKVLACKLARPRDNVVKAAVSNIEELVDIYSPGSYSTNTTINPAALTDATGYKLISTICTKTLTKILDENHCPRSFGILSIDVEGVDYQVLLSLDLDKYQPEVICIEAWESHKGIFGVLDGDIYKYLTCKGYELRSWSGLSTIYKRLNPAK